MASSKRAKPLLNRQLQRRVQNSIIYLSLVLILLGLVTGAYWGGVQIVQLKPEQMSIEKLPWALALSFLRMLGSYFFSLLFAFVLGLLAATTKTGERIIIPLLDVLQSVPVVGFFPAAITFFISVTNGHRLGVEMAAVFLIFTSQAWNMAFAVFEAVKAIPSENLSAIQSFAISGSKRFAKLYAPASVPRLVYNSILSWSNGWFFLVACEIIAVGPVRYHLPGIGSFLASSAEQGKFHLVVWGLIGLSSVIMIMDLLVWRPLTDWAERFKQDEVSGLNEDRPDVSTLLRIQIFSQLEFFQKPLAQMLKAVFYPLRWFMREVILPLFWEVPIALLERVASWFETPFELAISILGRLSIKTWVWILNGVIALGCVFLFVNLILWLAPPWPHVVLRDIPLAVFFSTLRLSVSLVICMALVFPVVFFIWDLPKSRQVLMTISQIGASLPAIALFPLIVMVAVKKLGGGMQMATLMLLLTGMVWYILFNCLGGLATVPADLIQAARSLGLSRWKMWQRLAYPAVKPALVTGAITAWGGGWNALVVSEYVVFKDQVLRVKGIGAMLNDAVYQSGDPRQIGLCLVSMVAWIILINTIFWRPLYDKMIDRYKIER